VFSQQPGYQAKLLRINHLGLKERQERDREAVARAILDAARELFVSHGYQEVSIRKIAERIEYSPAAIYSYFPSKDDIFFALAEEGFHLLFSFAGPPATAPASPVDGLRQMFWRYYEFSKQHPEYFALMFLDRSVPKINRNYERFGFLGDMKHNMVARIQQVIDAGAFPPDTTPHVIFRILLTATHGVATMRLCERLSPGEDADALARATLDAAILGLQAGAGRGINLPQCIYSDNEDKRHDS
jgi:AcrR family transcriptional regulator